MRTKLVYQGKDENGDSIWVDVSQGRGIPGHAGERPVEGEAMGCIETQVEQMRVSAKLSGFPDIEWVPDRDVEGFYNMRAPNAERWRQYVEHCGYTDKNGQYEGKRISKEELEAATRLVRERYPTKEGV